MNIFIKCLHIYTISIRNIAHVVAFYVVSPISFGINIVRAIDKRACWCVTKPSMTQVVKNDFGKEKKKTER